MKVSAIDIYTTDVEFLSVNLRTPSTSDKFLAKAVIGLDADELNPRFYGFGAVAGAKFNEFTRKTRDIVMRIALNPNYKLNERYSDIRDEFYKAISRNRTGEVRLVLRSGASSIADIHGHIVKLEVPHFSKISELQVTIRCDDPMFRGISFVELLDSELDAGTNTIEIVDALSTAPHGFKFEGTFGANTTNFTIRATDSDWAFTINYAFLAGDLLEVSSCYCDKGVYVIRNSAPTSLMDVIDIASHWPVVFPGFNEFTIENMANFSSKKVTYQTAYWGV